MVSIIEVRLQILMVFEFQIHEFIKYNTSFKITDVIDLIINYVNKYDDEGIINMENYTFYSDKAINSNNPYEGVIGEGVIGEGVIGEGVISEEAIPSFYNIFYDI